MAVRYRLSVENGLPNKRLKLTGGDRSKGTGVFAPWRARTFVHHSCGTLQCSDAIFRARQPLLPYLPSRHPFVSLASGRTPLSAVARPWPALTLPHGDLIG